MNFFEHQQQARRASMRLVLLFLVAVAGVVLAVNVVGALSYAWTLATPGGARAPAGFHLAVTLVTLALIGAGTWWETSRLAAGGEAVAQMVGARPLDPSTRDLLERRLLNVVEEMALASGTPVPRVYVMDHEAGINAFAAGHGINDAVIAVTRGTLTRLSRDELQGVVAHEFSHIFNGDMRLNLRLIGVLFGLMMIAMAGRFMMEVGRGGRDSKAATGIAVVGVALWLVGYVGVFCGRLIKAAVSRQREYLADSSAVQFTRNPDGIGGALRKIGGLTGAGTLGTEIRHPHAETLSHLFLGAAQPSFVAGLFATHPPVEERVRRIYGRSMGLLSAPEQPVALALAGSSTAGALPPIDYYPAGAAAMAAASPLAALAAAATPPQPQAIGRAAPQAAGYARSLTEQLRALELEPAVHDAALAQLLVLALVIEKSSAVAERQRQAIAEALGAPAAAEVDRLHTAVAQLPPGARLPLLDLAGPALRKLSAAHGDRLLMLAHTLVHADGRMTLAEFLLYTVLRRRVGSDSRRAVPVRYARVQDLAPAAGRVLSLLAHVRLPDSPERAFAAGTQALPAPSPALTPRHELTLEAIAADFERLNQLAPLAKPAVIRAAVAVAFVDGQTSWKAASCVRSLCAALDAPLPPQVAEA
ncbi:MAG: M48 family metallopeptidase [Betaproteobacteria bacterium]